MSIEYKNLVGKPFDLGKQDCFKLAIDFYKQNFDINIPNFSRPTNWNADNIDLIGMLHTKAGFEKVDTWDLRPGDALATAVGSSSPNHLVIYVGDNLLLHHKAYHLSDVETFRPAWRVVTCYVLRHLDVPDLTPVYPDVTIEELLRQRYSV